MLPLEQLVSAYRRGRRLALFFDYDGTLAPLVAHPCSAALPSATRQGLSRLAARPRISVAIVSGRALDDLRRMVDLPELYYAGTGGVELDLKGVRHRPPEAADVSDLLSRVPDLLNDLLRQFPGAWLETKPLGLTVHYRDVDREQVSRFNRLVVEQLQMLDGKLRQLPGPCAIELTPQLGWSKGTAVRRIIEHLGHDVLVLYAGDHCNDADAFAVVRSQAGVSIGIGVDAPDLAQARVSDPQDLQNFLTNLAEQVCK